VVAEAFGVAFACEFRRLVAGACLNGHVFWRRFGTGAWRGSGIDSGLTAIFAGLFDRVDEPLDVDARGLLFVLLNHCVRGVRHEMEQHVDVGWQVVVRDTTLNELHFIVEILWCAEVAVIEGDNLNRWPDNSLRSSQ
jgi:hypothetical protein